MEKTHTLPHLPALFILSRKHFPIYFGDDARSHTATNRVRLCAFERCGIGPVPFELRLYINLIKFIYETNCLIILNFILSTTVFKQE